jgi:hypothetical protein
MPFIGKPKSKDPIVSKAEHESQWVAEVYVNRRKVAEHRAANEAAAHSQAVADRSKYPGAEIRMREAPRGK